MHTFKFRIGGLECFSVSDGTHAFPAANFFANAGAEELQSALLRHGITDGRVVAPFCCFVVRTAGRTVLIDTGFGAGAGPDTGQLPANLEAAGISRGDVDAVERPEWYPNADLDPPAAIATRRRLLARAAQENPIVCAYHMPFPGVGRVGRNADGAWSWTPLTA